jgi:hypothetical protein
VRRYCHFTEWWRRGYRLSIAAKQFIVIDIVVFGFRRRRGNLVDPLRRRSQLR